ncbi:hypothetical protein AAU61_13455 [Desulfocarbo indianensis]|nr:hypothetical protein AAU61_13455 [Desulfocarbo indianensis]
MPRPRKCRLVRNEPKVSYFKPRGVPLTRLTELYLPVEGYEALRLSELEGLSQEEAAERMNVSRHTFGRVLSEARRIVAEAVVMGRALRIDGGHYEIAEDGGETSDQSITQGGRAFSPPASEELKMSKIAISSEGPTLDDKVDPRFGRAGGFIIVDPDTMEFTYLDNGASQARAQGAGIQTAEMVAKAGARVILTGFVGPKAFQALKAAGLSVGQDLEGVTVRQAVEKFKAGQVNLAEEPNRPGGWK